MLHAPRESVGRPVSELPFLSPSLSHLSEQANMAMFQQDMLTHSRGLLHSCVFCYDTLADLPIRHLAQLIPAVDLNGVRACRHLSDMQDNT